MIVAILYVRNDSVLGIFTNCFSAVVTVLAPRHIGRAGRKLNRFKR